MATVDLTTKFLPKTDEQFAAESKRSLVTNQNFTWDGAATVRVYKVSTGKMNDYARNGDPATGSRFGEVEQLNATTYPLTIEKDRSFTFVIDKLDEDETQQQLSGATALARQNREVVIPEVDAYTYGVMCTNAGTKPAAVELTAENIYDEICKAGTLMDEAGVPETGRVLVVTPEIYRIMKKCKEIVLDTDVGEDMRLRGVVSNLDGAAVQKVPASRLPSKFGFMLCHPCATVAPLKLQDYRIHSDPPGISGSLVEGRVVYDAFVLQNKAKAIYYQATT